jgi:chitodextrinase
MATAMLLALSASVIGAAPAQAEEERLTLNGVNLTWESQDFVMEERNGCRYVPFQLVNATSTEWLRVDVAIAGPFSAGSTDKTFIPLNPGARESFTLLYCGARSYGPAQVLLTTKTYAWDREGAERDVYLYPLPVTGLDAAAVAGEPNSVNLTWRAPDSLVKPEGYLVSWLGEEIKVLGASARIDGLPSATDVVFEVRALGGPLTSTPVAVTFRTPLNPQPRPPLPPEDPTNVAFSTVASTSARLTWQPPAFANPPVTGYEVLVSSAKGSSSRMTTDTSLRVTDLTPGTEYRFTVKAKNSLGTSPGFTTFAVTDKGISEPRNLRNLPLASATAVSLDWLAPLDNGGSPIAEYRVTWTQDGTSRTRTVTRSEVTISDLKPITRYTFSVRAANEEGNVSDPATLTLFTPLDPQDRPERPGKPVDVRVVDAQSSRVAIDWAVPTQTNPPVTGYLVSVKGGRAVEVDRTAAVLTGLTPSTTYEISVQALSTGGVSDPVTVWAKTAAGPAPAPAPKPQPFSPPAPSSGGATALPTNINGTVDRDGNPATVRQTAPGEWPARTVAKSGKPLPIEKRAGFVTNAGQVAQLAVAAKSPSVQKVTISLDSRTKTYRMTATLKPGKSSGSVTLAVIAPRVTVAEVQYEPLVATQKFTVKK